PASLPSVRPAPAPARQSSPTLPCSPPSSVPAPLYWEKSIAAKGSGEWRVVSGERQCLLHHSPLTTPSEHRERRRLADEVVLDGDPLQVDEQLAAARVLERVDDPGHRRAALP